MNREFTLPPSRDLPPNRLAERREHLVSEIAPRRAGSRSRRVRMVAFVAVALIVLIGSTSAIGGVRDFILDRGFSGLPPAGATPSTPESGELVLHYVGRSATHASDITPLMQIWVYADGRVIWAEESASSSSAAPEGANELTGYLEQRLTPAGVELLRSKVAGLLDRSRAVLVMLPADYDPFEGPTPDPARARDVTLFVSELDGWGTLEARDGDGFVGLHWVGDVSRPEGPIATPEQRSDIRRLVPLLTEPSSVLPASAWAVPKIRAYVPSHYQ